MLRAHRFYPLVELNWFHDTRRGDNVDLPFEGADLVNFGSREATDRDLVTIAPGFRYKFTEWAQRRHGGGVPADQRQGVAGLPLDGGFDLPVLG